MGLLTILGLPDAHRPARPATAHRPPPAIVLKQSTDEEAEARRQRSARALQDIEDAKQRWAREDSAIVDYVKNDFVDVTLTEGMENVSAVSGWVGTGAKVVPGGQGVAAAMEIVGLGADVTGTTYVVLKALFVDATGEGAGRIAQKGTEKIAAIALENAKKAIVRKLAAKYPIVPEPVLHKLVDEAVDRLVGRAAEAVGEGVKHEVERKLGEGTATHRS